jgi:hypothetical protein
VNFLAHTLAQGLVDHLMLLYAILAAKCGTHDDRFEMLTIAANLNVLARETLFDVRLHLLWSKQREITRREKEFCA